MVTGREGLLLLGWYGLAFGTLGLAEWLHRRWALPTHLTRKLIHVTAGSSTLFIVLLFERVAVGLIPFASFIVANLVFYRRRSFRGMDSPRRTPGTVYFAVAITLLLAWLWREGPADRSPLALAAIMMLTWGDAAAALVGERWGRHRLGRRTVEGSAAMFALSTTTSSLVLATLGGLPLPTAIGWSAVAASAATIAEAISPRGTDNLSVPLVAAATLVWLAGSFPP